MRLSICGFMIYLAACSNHSVAPTEIIFPLDKITYDEKTYLSIGMEYNSREFDLLIDTGAPTFILTPDIAEALEIEFDGSSEFRSEIDDIQVAPNIYELPISLNDCSRQCEHTFKRGLVRQSGSEKILGHDGVVNPSQFAWRGCIAIELGPAQIRLYSYELQSGVTSCPDSRLNIQPDLVLSHKYIGQVTLPNGSMGTALFDTGTQNTMVRAAVLQDDVKYSGKVKFTGYQNNGWHTLVSAAIVGIGDQQYDLSDIVAVEGDLVYDVDMIIGLDLLSQSTFVVGNNLQPHLYMSEPEL